MGLHDENELCSNCTLFKPATTWCGFWQKEISDVDICPRVEPELSKKYIEMVTPKPQFKPRRFKAYVKK